MHRKSAYILFLAVLGLLVIGIVMLFSTSAFARDSHGDVYYFVQQAGRLARNRPGRLHRRGAGRLPFLAAHLVDLVRPRGRCAGALLSCRTSACRSTAPGAGSALHGFTFQPSEFAKIAAVFFLAWWFSRYENESNRLWRGFRSSRWRSLVCSSPHHYAKSISERRR